MSDKISTTEQEAKLLNCDEEAGNISNNDEDTENNQDTNVVLEEQQIEPPLGVEEVNEIEANEQQESQSPGATPKVLSKTEEKRQLSKQEIAFGVSYFTTAYGYNNPYNVLTPQLLCSRFQPVQDLSYNSCVEMLREPFGGKKAENKLLAPHDVLQILDYRTSEADTLDFAEESFLMLGAKNLEDKISIRQLAKNVEICYADVEEEVEISLDYSQHCDFVHAELQAAEHNKAEREEIEEQKVPPFQPDYQVAGLEAIISVLREACRADEIGLSEWKSLFQDVSKLKFTDFAEEIRRGK